MKMFSQQLLYIFEINVYYRVVLVLIFKTIIWRSCKGSDKSIQTKTDSSNTLKLLEIIPNPGTVM